MKTKRRRPTTDSTLSELSLYHTGEISNEAYLAAITKFRVIRSNVICDAYGVEATLTKALALLFAPTSHTDGESPDVVNDCLLSALAFEKKIQVLRRCIKQFSILANPRCCDLCAQLNRVRILRNEFAHNPIVFRYDTKAKHMLIATLECPDKSLRVTSELVLKSSTDCAECTATLFWVIKQVEKT